MTMKRDPQSISSSLNQDRVLELAKRQLEKRMSQGSAAAMSNDSFDNTNNI